MHPIFDEQVPECPEGKKVLNTFDISLRLFYTIILLTHYVYMSLTNKNKLSDSEQWIYLLSIVIILLGVQNCSIAFYPWMRNLRLIFYSTFIVLMIFISVRDVRVLLFLEKKTYDPFYWVAESVFYFVLLPNLTCMLMSVLIFALVLLTISFVVIFQRMGFNVGFNYIPGLFNNDARVNQESQTFQ